MENIGSVGVQIVADYSQLSAGLKTAQAQAQTAGAAISSAFTSAAGSPQALEQAINRVNDSLNREIAALSLAIQRNAAMGSSSRSAASGVDDVNRALHGQVSELQAVSGELRVLEGSGGIRAAENFITKTLGLGPALKAIFPIAGAIALGELLNRLISEVTEFYQQAVSGAERAKAEFGQMNLGLETTNDELRLANDKLDNQIAKLTGKKENALKEMIDEAAVSVDRFAAKLDGALKQLIEFQKKEQVGFVEAAFTNQAPSQKTDQALGGKSGVGGARAEIAAIEDSARAKIKAAQQAGDLDAANNARAEARIQLEEKYTKMIQQQASELRTLQNIQKLHDSGALNSYLYPDNSKNIELAAGAKRNLEGQKEGVGLEFENVSKTQGRDKAQADKEGSELAKKAAQDQLRGWEEELAIQKSQGELSLTEEKAFWAARLPIAEAGGAAEIEVRRKIEETIGNLTQRISKQRREADLHEVAEEKKEFEAQLKAVMDNAPKGTEHAAGLGFVQETLAKDTINEGELLGATDKKPGLEKGKESDDLTNLHKTLADEEAAWKESQNRTATETIAFFEERKRLYANDAEVVKHANEQITGARKRDTEQTFQVTKIKDTNDQEAGQSDIAQRKVALEQAYALQVSHTYQEQVAYQQALNSLEAESLALKLQAADANLAAARTEGDVVKIAQAQLAQAQAQRAIDLQSVESEAKIAELKQKNSFGGQVSSGLNQDAQGAVSKLSDGIANLATQTKGWGQSFKNILKEIEHSLVQTFASAALKQGLNAILNGISSANGKGAGGKGGGLPSAGVGLAGGAAGALAGGAKSAAETANTTALIALNLHITALLAALGINATASATNTAATAADATVTTAHAGVMTAHLGVMVAHIGAMFANTFATLSNTLAVVWNSIVLAVKAIFGFAAGGDPPVGVPSLVGEKGPELFIPRGSGTIIPADKTKALLAQVKLNPALANVSFTPPDVPADLFTGGGSGSLGDTVNQSTSAVTNHNTGNIGTAHFNITESRNPRQTVREIANYMKLTSPKYSPQNS